MQKHKENILDTVSFKAASPLLIRLAAFLGIFIIYSGLIGPKIISSNIFSKDYFTIYGGLGKAALFAAISFIVLFYRKKYSLRFRKWNYANLIWIVLSLCSYSISWILVDRLVEGLSGTLLVIITHVALIISLILALIGCFGFHDLMKVIRAYQAEIILSIVISAGFYILLIAIYSLWTILASIVLNSVRWLLGNVNGIHVIFQSPRTLILSRFAITVAEYCSGIESLALFTGLYIFVGVLDWQVFKHKLFIGLFLPALLILFIFNILRVYLLILGGYYINPHIAFSLFHTYAGMIFFIVYSAIFWGLFYKRMLFTKRYV